MSEVNENLDFLSFPMYQERMRLFESLPVIEGGIVFVGDSLTQRNSWKEFFPGLSIFNRGINSDRSVGVLRRLDHIISLKPVKIFLMVGINDVYDNRDLDHILSNYENIVLRIKSELPNTQLFIQSLLPVNNSVFNHPIQNDTVRRVNKKLAELAEDNAIRYIDLYPYFLKDNELNEKYTVDGCHLSEQGYLTWVDVIKPFVTE